MKKQIVFALLGMGLSGCVFQEMKELPAAPDLDMAQDMIHDVPEDMPVDAPSDLPDMPEDMVQDVAEDMVQDVAEDMVQDVAEDMVQDVPPDMPSIPIGMTCTVANPPAEMCDPVRQQGCFPNQECKLILLQGVPKYTCLPKTSGTKTEGKVCALGLAGECGASMACIQVSPSVGALCLNICQLSDGLGCDGDGNFPACRNPVGTTGYGTCLPTCPAAT